MRDIARKEGKFSGALRSLTHKGERTGDRSIFHSYPRLAQLRWLGVPFLLTLLFSQMAASSARESATFDETYHLVSGYAYLHTGDPRLSWEHPPLVHVLAALPLLPRKDMAPFPTDHPRWQTGEPFGFVEEYLWVDNYSRAPDLIWAGRWPLMALTVLFGLAFFVALYTEVGELSAWIGLVLFVLDPNLIANGHLITTDLPVAGMMFVAVWRLGVYLRRPSHLNLALAGSAAGLALATKFSAVLIGPVFLLITLVYRPSGVNPLPLWRRLLALTAMAGLSLLVLWAVYGFELGSLEGGNVTVPAPTYLRGVPRVWQRISEGTPTYLLGRISDTGWWYYFFALLILKTPLPTLILLGSGLWKAFRRWRESALWLIPVIIYFVVASANPLQIGYRYILPVLIFIIAIAVNQFPTWPQARSAQIGVIILVAWAGVEAVRAFPTYIPYANELAGGPDNAWRHFADMNVDWGQDLVKIAEYEESNGIDDLRLAYFGSAYPSAYDVDAHLLPSFYRLMSGPEVSGYNPFTPEPGTYAISATSLHLGLIYQGRDLYAFFRDHSPDAQVGRSILIYRLDYPPGTPIDRAVVVGPDIWKLSPEGLGLEEGHRLVTKWSSRGGFVLAMSGPARYLVEAPVPDSPLVDAAISSETVFDAHPLLAEIPTDGTPTTPEGIRVALPVSFQGGLTLMGWTLSNDAVSSGQTLTLVTYWRIEEPLEPPLSVFVHLAGGDERPLTQWDGWPVAMDGLEAGDIVILSHPLPVPAEANPGNYTLLLGLYIPPDGARFPVAGTDRLFLTQVEVRPQ